MPRRTLAPGVYETSRRFREALVRRSDNELAQITAQYAKANSAVTQAMNRYFGKLAAEADRLGVDLSDVSKANPSWIFQARRLELLVDEIETIMGRNLGDLTSSAVAAQRTAIRYALEDARAMIESGATRVPESFRALQREVDAQFKQKFTTLPEAAFESLVGVTADGTPLKAIFYDAALGRGDQFRDELLNGFLLGQGPRQIARRISAVVGSDLARTLRIVRTETMRAYRTAQSATYSANPTLVTGWIWLSALDRRTCLGCISRHGTYHRSEEVLSDHPNGRCTMVPETRPWNELLPDHPELADVPPIGDPIETGAEWLRRQAPDVQAGIMGRTRAEAFARGADLDDLVKVRRDPYYGEAIGPIPIRDIPTAIRTPATDAAVAQVRRGAPARPSIVDEVSPTETAPPVIENEVPEWIAEIRRLRDGGVLDLDRALDVGKVARAEIERRMSGFILRERTPEQLRRLEARIEALEARGAALRLERDGLGDVPFSVIRTDEERAAVRAWQTRKYELDLRITHTAENLERQKRYLVGFETEEAADLREELFDLFDEYFEAKTTFKALGVRATQADLDRVNGILDQVNLVMRKTDAVNEAIDEAYGKAYREVAEEIREIGGVEINYARGGPSVRVVKVQKEIDAIKDFYPRQFLDESNRLDDLATGTLRKGQAAGEYSASAGSVRSGKVSINFAEGYDQSTIAIHEFGHRMEDALKPRYLMRSSTGEIVERVDFEVLGTARVVSQLGGVEGAADVLRNAGVAEDVIEAYLRAEIRIVDGPTIPDLERDFLFRRVGDDPTIKLPGYSSAYGRPDELPDAYIGRLYGGGMSPSIATSHEIGYEVFSSGMQAIKSNAWGAYQRDPEFVDLILGILLAL